MTFFTVVGVVIGLAVCFLMIKVLDGGSSILTKQQRLINNYLWQAQNHNATAIFVHYRSKHSYVQRKQQGKKKVSFEEHTSALAD